MINLPVFAAFSQQLWNADIWYSLPLIIAISLVYSATRHEEMGAILKHALKLGLWIMGFMAAFFLLLWLIS
ncbi:MAG TPA: hypothetical protein VIH42_05585 [Thermoguttaceae bacterium]